MSHQKKGKRARFQHVCETHVRDTGFRGTHEPRGSMGKGWVFLFFFLFPCSCLHVSFYLSSPLGANNEALAWEGSGQEACV